jgi:hypothetical protein
MGQLRVSSRHVLEAGLFVDVEAGGLLFWEQGRCALGPLPFLGRHREAERGARASHGPSSTLAALAGAGINKHPQQPTASSQQPLSTNRSRPP